MNKFWYSKYCDCDVPDCKKPIGICKRCGGLAN